MCMCVYVCVCENGNFLFTCVVCTCLSGMNNMCVVSKIDIGM